MPAPSDAAKVTRAEELLHRGAAPADVAEQTGLSPRTVYRIKDRIGIAPPPTTPSTGSPSPPPPVGPEAGFTVQIPPIPPGLAGDALDLWLLDERVQAVRTLLHQAQARIASGGSPHGLAALEGVLARLLAQRAGVRPPTPPDAAAEERTHRAEGDRVLTQIEAGVSAAEEQTKTALRSALAPWPGAAEVAIVALYPTGGAP
jgi:hypothetical protein